MTRTGAFRPQPRAMISRRRPASEPAVAAGTGSDTCKRQLRGTIIVEKYLVHRGIRGAGRGDPAREVVLPHPLKHLAITGRVEFRAVRLEALQPPQDRK